MNSNEHLQSVPVSRRGMLLQLTAAGAVLGDERALGATPPPSVGLAAVSTVEALRAQTIPSSAAVVLVLDFRQNGDGGGGTFVTLIDHANTNGVHIQSCWLTVCQTGIDYHDHSGDAYVKDCTAEYCEAVARVDATSEVVIDGCNFWQSAAGVKYTGVKSLGAVRCQNTRFIGFGGAGIDSSGPLHATGNEFTSEAGPVSLLMSSGADSIIIANRFHGGSLSAMVWVSSHSTVTGNSFQQTSPHACLNITQGATRTVVSGNVFRYGGETPIVEGGLVVSVQQDVSWKTGCSHCLITGNSFDGANGVNMDTSPARSNQVSDNL